MAKPRSAIYGEYVIECDETGKVTVYKVYDNVIGSLREIAEKKGFEVDPKWNTRQFGANIIKAFGEGKTATVGEYVVNKLDSGTIETYRYYDNTKGALREVAAAVGFDLQPDWNTHTAGRKLVDFLNENN